MERAPVNATPGPPGEAEIPSVTPGVYFAAPRALPRGRHRIAPDEVRAAQRERLMVAFTELLAARGYAALRISDIVERAGVSRVAFYACFTDLTACATEAYDRFIAVLTEQIVAGLRQTDDFALFARSTLEAYLGTIERDPVASRAFQVEMDGAGAEARRRRRNALGLLAELIRIRHEELLGVDPRLSALPPAAHVGLVYAVRQLACDLLEEQAEPDMSTLRREVAAWIGATYFGDSSMTLAVPEPESQSRAPA